MPPALLLTLVIPSGDGLHDHHADDHRFQRVRARRNRGAPVTAASLLKKFLPLRHGTAIVLAHVPLTPLECCVFDAIESFHASTLQEVRGGASEKFFDIRKNPHCQEC